MGQVGILNVASPATATSHPIVKLSDKVLAAAAAAISFPGLPTGFDKLIVEGDVLLTAACGIAVTFNNDGAANYNYQHSLTNGGAPVNTTYAAQTATGPQGLQHGGVINNFRMVVQNTAAARGKSFNIIAGAGANYLNVVTGNYMGNSEITRIDLTPSFDFAIGTHLSVYGLKA